ncbi:MAG: hypothetical protein DDT28_00412 [Dehalococcoidia bacterium]|nr:hypothetical protein [Chloroflexota bacterium]
MATLHEAATEVQPRSINSINAQQLHAGNRTNDINNSVQSTELVKMHLVDILLMYPGFGLSQSNKYLPRQPFNLLGQCALPNYREDIFQAAGDVLFAQDDVHFCALNTLLCYFLHFKLVMTKGEFIEFGP